MRFSKCALLVLAGVTGCLVKKMTASQGAYVLAMRTIATKPAHSTTDCTDSERAKDAGSTESQLHRPASCCGFSSTAALSLVALKATPAGFIVCAPVATQWCHGLSTGSM